MLEWIKKKLENICSHEPAAIKTTQAAVETPLEQQERRERFMQRFFGSLSIDRLEILIRSLQQNYQLSKDISICIVLDTSFLMLEKTPSVFELLSSCQNHDLRIIYSIPDVVLNEVVSHFGTEKDSFARIARKRIAQLVEKSAEVESLGGISPIERFDSLSADSETDRKIISHALAKANDHHFVCVLLATDDGGIMYDVARYRSNGARIACLTKETKTEDISSFICGWLIAKSPKGDLFMRQIGKTT